MATKLLTVEDNTAPLISLTLERSGDPIQLLGATVDLHITKDGTLVNSGHTSCVVTSDTAGTVSYYIQPTDLQNAGTYQCEVKITYGDATVETLYEKFNIAARQKLAS